MTDVTGGGDRSWGMLLKHAEQALVKTKSAALKPAGATPAQYVALTELETRPGITAAALARRCRVSPQAMMVALKGMEDQGLVVRTPHPRHPNVLEIHPTAVGHETLAHCRDLVAPIERRLEAALSDRDGAQLAALLERVITVLEPRDPG